MLPLKAALLLVAALYGGARSDVFPPIDTVDCVERATFDVGGAKGATLVKFDVSPGSLTAEGFEIHSLPNQTCGAPR